MGFDLLLMRLDADGPIDADRDGIRRFVAERGLALSVDERTGDEWFVTSDGQPYAPDGDTTSLHLDSLAGAGPVTGFVDHCGFGREHLGFIYGLCVAGGMAVVNPQRGWPTIVVPAHNHDRSQLPEDSRAEAVYVDSADEFHRFMRNGPGSEEA